MLFAECTRLGGFSKASNSGNVLFVLGLTVGVGAMTVIRLNEKFHWPEGALLRGVHASMAGAVSFVL